MSPNDHLQYIGPLTKEHLDHDGDDGAQIDDAARSLMKAETEQIRDRRSALRLAPADSVNGTTGLALSGGGIRSATFALGVTQALANRNLMKHFDYLSTVSGGGYLGSALTWWWTGPGKGTRALPATGFDSTGCPSSADEFPFGSDDPRRWRGRPGAEPGPRRLTSLRRRGAYLIPGDGIDLWSLAAVLLRGVLVNLLIWLPLLTAIFALVLWAAPDRGFTRPAALSLLMIVGFLLLLAVAGAFAYGRSALARRALARPKAPALIVIVALIFFLIWMVSEAAPPATTHALTRGLGFALGLAIVVLLTFVACCVVYSFRTFPWRRRRSQEAYRLRRLFETWAGRTLLLSVGALAIGLLPPMTAALLAQFGNFSEHWQVASGGATVSGGAMLAAITMLRNRAAVAAHRLPPTGLATAASALLLYGLLLIAYALAQLVATPDIGMRLPAGAQITLDIENNTLSLDDASPVSSLARHPLQIMRPVTLLTEERDAVALKADALDLTNAPDAVFATEEPKTILRLAESALLHVKPATWPKWVLGGAVVLALFAGRLANVNYTSYHRMYRDRLMEVFTPDPEAVGGSAADVPAPPRADNFKLQEARGAAPVHLINTNLVLVNAHEPRLRLRGGDSFTLSPHYCGSNATGWIRTESFMRGSLTLPTAMAISGAAANPNAGSGGVGPTRSRALSLLMTLFNLRLGYWAPNPRFLAPQSGDSLPDRMRRSAAKRSPNYFLPNLRAALLQAHTETSPQIELSDGGHFDNLGLYELVRRRCRLILVVDASADPRSDFSDLQVVLRRVAADFGARITFGATPRDLNDDGELGPLIPREAPGVYPRGVEMAETAHLCGWIVYADGSLARLIYLTTAMVPGLPLAVRGYKDAHPEFPDESTADQFFNEDQFEAYRELGYALADRMVRESGLESLLESIAARPAS